MANRKQRRQQQRRPERALSPVSPASSTEGGTAAAAPAPATPSPAASGARHVPAYAAGVTAPRRAAAAAASGPIIDIDARVPYFVSDIRRLLITAGTMLVLIIVASFLLH